MVKVINISVTEHTFANQFKKPDATAAAAIKKCAALLPVKEILELLPKAPRNKVRFTLDQTNSQLANAIRRTLVDEIPTHTMSFDLMTDKEGIPADFIHDLHTDDKYIFGKCDELLKRIEAIPIRQNINPSELKISLDVKNDETELINIYSSHFKIYQKGKQIPVDQLMFPHYILTRLRPHCYLKITNIRIDSGVSSHNANKYKHLANTYYEIDSPPLQKINGKFIGKSSMDSDYTKFFMGYTTYRNYLQPFAPIKTACELLVGRIKEIFDEWTKIKNDEPSDKINKYQIGEIHIIEIAGENYTMANLLFYYIYKEMPNIEFATGGIQHIEKNIAVIKIKHREYWTLLANAATAVIKDLEVVNKSF